MYYNEQQQQLAHYQHYQAQAVVSPGENSTVPGSQEGPAKVPAAKSETEENVLQEVGADQQVEAMDPDDEPI